MGQVKFNFDNHVLDTDRRELRRHGHLVAMQPQVFDLLVHLLKYRDRVVTRDDLIALVWGGRIVSDSTLDSRINAARSAIGDNGKEQRLIRTIPRKGVRFVGAVNAPCQAKAVATSAVEEERPHSALKLPDRPAIAVLPFDNMSGDREQEYFSDGINLLHGHAPDQHVMHQRRAVRAQLAFGSVQPQHRFALALGDRFAALPAIDKFPGRVDRARSALGLFPVALERPPGLILRLVDLAVRMQAAERIVADRTQGHDFLARLQRERIIDRDGRDLGIA